MQHCSYALRESTAHSGVERGRKEEPSVGEMRTQEREDEIGKVILSLVEPVWRLYTPDHCIQYLIICYIKIEYTAFFGLGLV